MFKGYPLRSMLDIARAADELGFDYLCLAEHVLMQLPGAEMHPADKLMPERFRRCRLLGRRRPGSG